jgi:hypothetical protein
MYIAVVEKINYLPFFSFHQVPSVHMYLSTSLQCSTPSINIHKVLPSLYLHLFTKLSLSVFTYSISTVSSQIYIQYPPVYQYPLLFVRAVACVPFLSSISITLFQNPTWSVLLDSEYADFEVFDINIQGWTTCKCYSAYIQLQLMCVHVCLCTHMHWGGGACRGIICRCSELLLYIMMFE